MDDLSEGCYCIQAQTCPHWVATNMDRRLSTAKEHSHERTKTFEQERLQEDHRPIVNELQRELREALMEIEKLVQTSRDLARDNQDLKESQMLALNEQTRTARRLMLVSSQLEYTEQRLFSLTRDMDDGQKDSELLRIERIKREALQEREDAGRLRIESLQDELQEVQKSERLLQQKLLTIQNKYETLAKRHDNLKRQQQELELARESKEALAWLKETTDRLCSPPQGSLGQVIQQERSSHGSGGTSVIRSSPSSSPPYPSSFIDPPLAAQNQLISLIKELATTNSTLRSELNEYRDLLQDTRNEILTLRAQVEDYEQGHAFEGCCGVRMDDGDSFRTSKSAWSALDASVGAGLDAVSHIGTLGSIPGSPPPYMTTPTVTSKSRHHHFHVRGNVFGELERLYSRQGHPPSSSGRHKGRSHSSSKKSRRRTSQDRKHDHSHSNNSLPSDHNHTTTVSTSTSTSEVRRGSMPLMTSRSPPNPTPSKLRDQYDAEGSSPASNVSKGRRSTYTDADLDMLNSGSDSDGGEIDRRGRDSDRDDEDFEDGHERGFIDTLGEIGPSDETNGFAPSSSLRSRRLSPTLLPPTTLDCTEMDNQGEDSIGLMDSIPVDRSDDSDLVKNRSSSISLLSAELQRATRLEGDEKLDEESQDVIHPMDECHPTKPNNVEVPDENPSPLNGSKTGRDQFMQLENSSFDQGVLSTRQRRRLSEPLHSLPMQDYTPPKKNRPGSIYSLRRPRHHMGSLDLHCFHSGHVVSASAGCLPELQRCKSAEQEEQLMTERRHRMMEAWRVGVVAAAVTQQQSVHSPVAFSGQRMDTDSLGIRSSMSRKAGAGSDVKELHETQIPSEEVNVIKDSAHMEALPPLDPDSTVMESKEPESTTTRTDNRDTDGAIVFDDARNLTLNLSVHNNKNRHSIRSAKSKRASVLHSPMARLSHANRDRRFPSETSAASEAFSNRRYDQEQSPYQLLHTLAIDLMERLARSDTRELNRRLRRTFDIQALSQLSNSVIENVLTDVNNLNERFRWVEAQVINPTDEAMEHQGTAILSDGDEAGQWSQREDTGSVTDGQESLEPDWGFSVEEFFPLAHAVQEMLSEIGKLRMTINELQRSYVQKVEQDRIKAERDFMQEFASDEEGDYSTHDDLEPQEISEQTREKPTQLKNVLTMLDGPRMMKSSSTGVTGFFNKVFRGNGSSTQDPAKSSTGASHVTGAPIEAPQDKPGISKSKSGLVIAETSMVFADSPWMSTPRQGQVDEPTTTRKHSINADGPRVSTSRGIIISGARLSATTSLTAMATMSPARLSSFNAADGLKPVPETSTSKAGPTDINFASDRQQHNVHRSLTPSSSISNAHQGIVTPPTTTRAQVANELTVQIQDQQLATRIHPDQSPTHAAATSLSSSPGMSAYPQMGSLVVPSGLIDDGALTQTFGQGIPISNSDRSPHSLVMSARTSGPAANVITRQDVFQEMRPTSKIVSVSTTPSGSNAVKDEARSGEDSGAAKPISVSDSHRTSSSSIVSISTNSVASETISMAANRPISKPTLISRSALAAGTPSTSTVSSPMSAMSWLDSRRLSGSVAPDGPSVGGLKTQAAGSVTASLEPGFEPGQGPVAGTVPIFHKTRAVTSFHTSAALGGLTDSTTKSLGHVSGRESALAFLRGEMPSSSLLNSFFQSQSQSKFKRSQSQSQSQTPVGSPTRKSFLKGKGLAPDLFLGDNAKTDLEIQGRDPENHIEAGSQRAITDDSGRSESSSRRSSNNMAVSRSDTMMLTTGSMMGPTSTTTASTAVAYVVATPDAHGPDEKEAGGSRKKRAVFDRELIKASQKRILAGVPHQERPFVPEARQHRPRALSVDSAQSTEPLKANEVMDLWRAGAGVSRDIWRGFIKKVDPSS
ncbi:hypothetical protein BG011_003825 [Mortierella polycephala]|uniref:Uncharacterized protein n=1 Tax=Mortierella polycephala TaxID=41804 RepID=A0A9P6QF75_9FUNG|nr:hypothetical protein BG011_003825 [Mortierella polycephala]